MKQAQTRCLPSTWLKLREIPFLYSFESAWKAEDNGISLSQTVEMKNTGVLLQYKYF